VWGGFATGPVRSGCPLMIMSIRYHPSANGFQRLAMKHVLPQRWFVAHEVLVHVLAGVSGVVTDLASYR
jgi:hypothetical protein